MEIVNDKLDKNLERLQQACAEVEKLEGYCQSQTARRDSIRMELRSLAERELLQTPAPSAGEDEVDCLEME